jgi:hypothetical protein
VLHGAFGDRVRQYFIIHISDVGIRFENTSDGEVLTLNSGYDSPYPHTGRAGAFCATLCVGESKIDADSKRWAAFLAMLLGITVSQLAAHICRRNNTMFWRTATT